ncbi:hypothetical protein P9112_005264 [Eukaryota sp. TZLM1-RC]
MKPSTLESFDWRVVLGLASSHVAKLRQPLCQLSLVTKSSDSSLSRTLLELDQQSLESLIAQIERLLTASFDIDQDQ